MADNTVLNPGSGGDTIASDDIAGVKWQRVKIGHGADGSATDVSSASPLPVDTELPAAAALSDSTANPTAPMVGAAGMVWNATNARWERAEAATPSGFGMGAVGVPASVPHQYDAAAGQYMPSRSARDLGDGDAGAYHGNAHPKLYNGSSFDRERGNTEGTLLASAARTAITFSSEQFNYNARGVRVELYVTAKAATTNLNIFLCGEDSSNQLVFLAGVSNWAAAVNTGTAIELYPGITPLTATVVGGSYYLTRVSGSLSRRWYLYISPGDADSVTYFSSYSLIV